MSAIYHEKQKLQLCGAAAVNNLLQKEVYTRQSLNQIADSLPKIGTSLFFGYSSLIGLGNYSADVLIIALQNQGMEVTYFDKRRRAELEKILYNPNIQGLLINQVTYRFKIAKSNHWLAVLKLDQEWYNLDGKLNKAEIYKTTKDFIIRYLDQLHEDSSFFIVCNKDQDPTENHKLQQVSPQQIEQQQPTVQSQEQQQQVVQMNNGIKQETNELNKIQLEQTHSLSEQNQETHPLKIEQSKIEQLEENSSQKETKIPLQQE